MDKIPLTALWAELEHVDDEDDDIGQIATWRLDKETNELVIEVWAQNPDGGHLRVGTVELARIQPLKDKNGQPVLDQEGRPAYEAAMVRYVFALTHYEPSAEFERAYYPPPENGRQIPEDVERQMAERIRQMEEDDTISFEEAATTYNDAIAQVDMDNDDTEDLSDAQIEDAVSRALESMRQQDEGDGEGG